MEKTIPLLLILSFQLSSCLPHKEPPTSANHRTVLDDPIVEPQPKTKQSACNVLPTQAEPNTSHKHALLIGIEKYNHPHISNLKGAINDVQLMKGVLRERFGFQEEDFMTLLNEQATHSCIEKAFKKLSQRVQPKDFVYIHYSGHGAHTTDLNGDEKSGSDQTWTSFGSRLPGKEKDNFEVLDDEIQTWLAEIKTDHLVFISDSCHSATVARGRGIPVSRGLEPDDRAHLLGKMPYTKLEKYRGIYIGAARDQESAAETLGEDNKSYGLFTWHWAKALQQAQVGDTWNEIFKRTHTQVFNKRGEAQRPQLSGKAHRQIFGGQFTPPVATVPVIHVDGKKVKIQAGATAGVTKGSVYGLPQQQARLEITKVKTFESEAQAEGTFKVGDLVVEKSHAYNFDPIKVYVEEESLLQTIKAAFNTEELPGYLLTEIPEKADLRLQIYKNNIQPPELWILTPERQLLHHKLRIQFNDVSKGIELLQHNLNQLRRIREIKALKSRYQGTEVKVQVEIFTLAKTCPTDGECIPLYNLGLHHKKGPYQLKDIGQQTLNKDDILTFTLHNESRQDYFYYLINISSDGSIYAIYPNPEERLEYARVRAGATRSLINEVALILKETGKQTLKLIATTRPMDISLLQGDGYKGRKKEDLNPLEQLMVNAAHGNRARLLRISNKEWLTRQVEFEVNDRD